MKRVMENVRDEISNKLAKHTFMVEFYSLRGPNPIRPYIENLRMYVILKTDPVIREVIRPERYYK